MFGQHGQLTTKSLCQALQVYQEQADQARIDAIHTERNNSKGLHGGVLENQRKLEE